MERAWLDYAPAVRDIEWALASSGGPNGLAIGAAGAFQVGTVWVTLDANGPKKVLLVLERAGERFRARIVNPDHGLRLLEVSGTISDGNIAWLGEDVMSKEPIQAPDTHGRINGELIRMNWSGNGVPGSGSYVLRLKKN